jgi:hypothetical protein
MKQCCGWETTSSCSIPTSFADFVEYQPISNSDRNHRNCRHFVLNGGRMMTELVFQHLIEHVALEVLGVALKPHLKAF